ncbi:hypothetical protein [Cognatiyoonia sp. IB215182]|uniref:hypothetical protein n=1 Tax=Cognatiyoonia sp. IB215182 TaxID=3097353 RepID=UPI002A1121B9|nr:hypothetical protein [Cognatiyoonia sp. IB215182]MDX8355532.1 hypothetical protein [Cognatiyoonia sp. IB215182]
MQCERFDSETCEMVRDWSMLMQIENSVEADRISEGTFVLHRLRKKSEYNTTA